MKLATYKDGSRDGQLLVVSRDLATAHYASGVAGTLQQVLEDWNFLSPQLQDLYDALNQGRARHAFPFEPARCMAPLPRAYQWVQGAAFMSHAELLQRAGGAELPAAPDTAPLMHQGCSDNFCGPCDDVMLASEDAGIDFDAQMAVVSADMPMGCTPEQALEGIRLVMLANELTLRHVATQETARGSGLVHSKPATAFSPVAVTLDELGSAWQQGRVHLTLQSTWNNRKVGLCDAGAEMSFHFGQLIAHLCKTRKLRAGSVIGSGTVSNRGQESQGQMQWPKGYHCIAEKRAMETLQDGQAATGFMKFGDTIRIEMKDLQGAALFGAIAQTIQPVPVPVSGRKSSLATESL